MTRITVINPNTTAALTATIVDAAARVIRPGVELVGVQPDFGVPTVESHTEEAFAAVGVLEQVRLHAVETDAFVVACFGDTGVAAARELATGPVVGMTEAALQTASLIAHRFAVVTMPPRTIAHSDRIVRTLGLEHRCTVHAADVTVSELAQGAAEIFDAFEAEGQAAIADGAEAIILGCAGLADLVKPLSTTLGVPVVEGVAAAVGAAQSLLSMGLSTSRRGAFGSLPAFPALQLRSGGGAA
jgi:allantoin racemase